MPNDEQILAQLALDAHDDVTRYRSALRAIRARMNGVFDDPDLLKFGPLMPSTPRDIERIIAMALKD